jgi:hypothetical protein
MEYLNEERDNQFEHFQKYEYTPQDDFKDIVQEFIRSSNMSIDEDDYDNLIIYLNYMFHLVLIGRPPTIKTKPYFRSLYSKFEIWYEENYIRKIDLKN